MNMISLMFCDILKFFRKLENIAGKTGRISHAPTHAHTHTRVHIWQIYRRSETEISQTHKHFAIQHLKRNKQY